MDSSNGDAENCCDKMLVIGAGAVGLGIAQALKNRGIPYDQVRAIIADTSSLGHNDTTDGSRVTFAAGLSTIHSALDAIK